MTENRRTLTEELNSVLRAHALDAPEPSRVIEAALADAAGRPAPASRRRPGWLTRPAQLGNWVGAAVVVGLVVGIGAVILRSDPASNKATSSAVGAAAAPAAGASAGAGGGFGYAYGSQAAAGAAAAPSAAPPSARADNSTACPGGLAPETTTVTAQQDYDVDTYYCAATATSPAGSLVEVRTHEIPNARILATLVRPAQGLRVDYVSAVDNTIIVRAQVANSVPVNPLPAVPSPAVPSPTSSAVPPGDGVEQAPGEFVAVPGNGNVQDLTFTVNATATSFTPSATELVAKACTRSAVTASIGPRSGTSAAIAVVNKSAYPCALTGYPSVQGKTANGVVTADQTLSGISGGVTDSPVPPVVVIPPGGQATAILELTNYQSFCGFAPLTLSLPGIGSVFTSSHGYGLCSLQVHPFVEGTTGSSG